MKTRLILDTKYGNAGTPCFFVDWAGNVRGIEMVYVEIDGRVVCVPAAAVSSTPDELDEIARQHCKCGGKH